MRNEGRIWGISDRLPGQIVGPQSVLMSSLEDHACGRTMRYDGFGRPGVVTSYIIPARLVVV